MTSEIDRFKGRVALLFCHCAGMVDLIAMPVWIDVLIRRYGLGPQRAGALVSVFLLAAVITSSLLASRFTKRRPKPIAVAGFAIAALVFAASAMTTQFSLLAALYALGGLGVGCGLSMTHGTMGRSGDPHKMFGLAGAAAGLFSIVFYGATSALVIRYGGSALFLLLAGVMSVASLLAAFAFPNTAPLAVPNSPRPASASGVPLAPAVWLAIFGVIGMALNQALASSFLQNIGLARGFAPQQVQSVLIALGIVALFPGPLALALRKRLPTRVVLTIGPLVQVLLIYLITHSLVFWPYAIAGVLATSMQIFMHTFAFSFIARLDTTGRAPAATPAMLMTGSAIGPFLAGSLVAAYGYGSLAYAAGLIGLLGAGCYALATSRKPHNGVAALSR